MTSACNRYQVSIEADPTLPIFRITRDFGATPLELMRAHTDHIVQTFTFDGQPHDVALDTLRFDELGDGHSRLHAQLLVDSFEGRDQWLASGMDTGAEQGYSKLDALVGELR